MVGFVEAERYETIYEEEPMLNVLGLVVDSSARRRGIAAQLMAALEDEAGQRQIGKIRLNSGEQRTGAHAFYEKQGYSCNHSQKRFLKTL